MNGLVILTRFDEKEYTVVCGMYSRMKYIFEHPVRSD